MTELPYVGSKGNRAGRAEMSELKKRAVAK